VDRTGLTPGAITTGIFYVETDLFGTEMLDISVAN
jgi:hypothetical protein